MTAADTSTWVAFLGGDTGADADLLDRALQDGGVIMVPAVLTELLSDYKLPSKIAETILGVPLAEMLPGYWERTGRLRAKVLSRGRRARMADALIAQCCIDLELSLLTRDRDFRAFFEAAGLDLLIPY